MIILHDIDGRKIFIRETAVTAIIDKPGIHTQAFVQTNDGVYEVRENAQEIYRMINETNLMKKG